MAAARLMAVVVLPTPPFWLAIVRMAVIQCPPPSGRTCASWAATHTPDSEPSAQTLQVRPIYPRQRRECKQKMVCRAGELIRGWQGGRERREETPKGYIL